MTLRRALCVLPLTMLVAVLAHFVVFGFAHAPGTTGSANLFGSLAVGLALLLLVPFVSGLTGNKSGTQRHAWYAPLLLAGAGVATFGLIEACEGHAIFTAILQAACAAVPLAYAIAAVARYVGSIARRAGGHIGSFVRRNVRQAGHALAVLLRARPRLSFASLATMGPRPGRAPPTRF